MILVINAISAQDCCCGVETEIEVPGGDFETSPFPNPGGWIDYSSGEALGPWVVSFGSVSHHDDGHNNLGAGNPNPSTAHVDLHGFSEGGICQDISGFTIGQEYELVFYYAVHNAAGSADGLVEVDGGAALSESWTASNQGQDIWLEAIFTFTATAETMDLCFSGSNAPGCCGMLIDDIEISFTCNGDVEFPELFNVPFDEIYQCLDDVPPPPFVDATDNCVSNVNVLFDEEIDDSNPCEITIIRSWAAEDNCGNLTEGMQEIFVADTEAPEIIMQPFDLNIACGEDVEDIFNDWIDAFGGAELIDACGDVFNDTNFPIIDFSACSSTEVVFTYSDFCGNEILAIAEFNVGDNIAPNFDVLPQNLNVPCGDNEQDLIDHWLAQNGEAEVSDLCGFNITNNFNGDYGTSQTVTFTATDLCGTQSSAVSEIIINNSQVEVDLVEFTCVPENAGQEMFLIDNAFCDTLISLTTLLLASDTTFVELSTCNPLEAGADTIFLSNINNCDSLVISNTIYFESDITHEFATSCNSMDVGMDTLVLLNTNSCDSLIITNTVFAASDTSYINIPSCDVGQVGTDTFYLLNSNNCDSMVVINVFFASIDTSFITLSTCDFNEVDVDTVNLTSLDNCDSVVVFNSILVPMDTTYFEEYTCEMSEVGVDTIYLLNTDGCDSIVVHSSVYTANDTIIITEYTCEEMESFYSMISGPICDTLLIMEYVTLESDSTFLEQATCKLEEVETTIEQLVNEDGCNSLVITNYIYEPIDTIVIMTETCFLDELIQDTIEVFGNGCDSVYIISTVLLEGNESLLEEFVCDPLEAGVDSLFLQNGLGCDSLVIIESVYQEIEYQVQVDYDPCDENALAVINIVDIVSPQALQFSIDGENFSNEQSFSDLSSGDYQVYAMDGQGCVHDPVHISFEPNNDFVEVDLPTLLLVQAGVPTTINLNFSEEPSMFYWSNTSLLSCVDCLSPTITALETQELVLYYQDSFGCQYSQAVEILVQEIYSNIYVPNVFTPDKDSNNDYFQLYNFDTSVNVQSCIIYDRWGNQVYNLVSNNPVDLKWDGTKNGEELISGVYVYHILLKNQQGELNHLVGSVSLLR